MEEKVLLEGSWIIKDCDIHLTTVRVILKALGYEGYAYNNIPGGLMYLEDYTIPKSFVTEFQTLHDFLLAHKELQDKQTEIKQIEGQIKDLQQRLNKLKGE